MIAETTEAPTTTEFVLTFPPAPENPTDPESNYRCWLAPLRFQLVHRTRPIGKHTITIEWWDVVDPSDQMVMGVVREMVCGIDVKLHTKTVDPKTGKPGRTLRDTFTCVGGLGGPGPWTLGRVPPCRKGCESCVAPDTLMIARV